MSVRNFLVTCNGKQNLNSLKWTNKHKSYTLALSYQSSGAASSGWSASCLKNMSNIWLLFVSLLCLHLYQFYPLALHGSSTFGHKYGRPCTLMILPKWKSITIACAHVMGLFIGSEWEKNICSLTKYRAYFKGWIWRGQFHPSHMIKDLRRVNSPRIIRILLVGNRKNECQDGNQFICNNSL